MTIRELQNILAAEKRNGISDFELVDVYDNEGADIVRIAVDHESKQVLLYVES